MTAEFMAGLAEHVPGVGLAVPVTDLLVQQPGLLTGDQRLLMVAERTVPPGHVVQRPGLAGPVAGRPEQVVCASGMLERALVITLPVVDPAEVEVQPGLTGEVTHG